VDLYACTARFRGERDLDRAGAGLARCRFRSERS
jgi:hypothetical protein